MTNRFKEDVKRIVGTERETAEAVELEDKGGVAPVRGIGTQTSGGRIVQSTQSPSQPIANQDPEAGTEANSAPPNDFSGGARDADTGVYAADDLLDGNDGPDSIGDTLNGITATDCASGKELRIRTDGYFDPIDEVLYENGGIQTIGWEDPDTPPSDPYWKSGVYYETAGIASTRSYSPTLTGEAYMTWGEGAFPGEVWNLVGVYENPNIPGAYLFDFDRDAVRSTGNTINTVSGVCTVGVDVYCPSAAPTQTQWPSDNQISLTLRNGKFITSQYDGDATSFFSGQDLSKINFCMDGGRFGSIEVGKNGSYMIYETSTANGAVKTDSPVKVYDRTGKLIQAGGPEIYNTFTVKQ